MWGTIINTAAIVLGGALGLTVGKSMPASYQHRIKLLLGIVVIYIGLTTTWKAINGSLGAVTRQIIFAFLALILGNIVGKVLRLQKGLTRLGLEAQNRFQKATPGDTKWGDGFVTCTLLFCVGPMAILGSIQDGLNGNIRILLIKSVMDGIATAAFARTFGWGVMLSALPVLAYQGTITLAAGHMESVMRDGVMLDAMNATGGLLLIILGSVIMEVQKAPLANYLPSLAIAPLLAKFWR